MNGMGPLIASLRFRAGPSTNAHCLTEANKGYAIAVWPFYITNNFVKLRMPQMRGAERKNCEVYLVYIERFFLESNEVDGVLSAL